MLLTRRSTASSRLSTTRSPCFDASGFPLTTNDTSPTCIIWPYAARTDGTPAMLAVVPRIEGQVDRRQPAAAAAGRKAELLDDPAVEPVGPRPQARDRIHHLPHHFTAHQHRNLGQNRIRTGPERGRRCGIYEPAGELPARVGKANGCGRLKLG